jgi:hypothetical protein
MIVKDNLIRVFITKAVVSGSKRFVHLSCMSLILCSLFHQEAKSQDFNGKVGLFTFFDNTEFSGSSFKVPQTMSGVALSPEVGLRWDSAYWVGAGVSLVHEFGSVKAIDYYYPTAYIHYNKEPFRFTMGAFPRNNVLEKYPRIFFQDSISYYRPNINGLFWEIGKNQDYLNVWLDWTGRQTEVTREAFFIGFSGRYNIGILYAQHFGYMYHFASKENPIIDEALHDNLLFLTSLGVNLAPVTGLSQLDFNMGWAIALERSRADQTGVISRGGLLMESRVEYKGIGLFNTFYKGEGTQYFYNDHGNELYWGDPLYRARTYNRSDIYIKFLRNSKVNMKLVYSLHFLESNVFHEQSLKVSIDINRFSGVN